MTLFGLLIFALRLYSQRIASRPITPHYISSIKQDGWSVSGVKANLSDSLVALNFENGAHHSDLSHLGPNPRDSEDIKEGYKTITRLLGEWLGREEFSSDFDSTIQ